MARRLTLPRRFNAGLTETAYRRLRKLSAETGLGNNYCLVVLLENLDRIADPDKLDEAYGRFIADYCPPDRGAK